MIANHLHYEMSGQVPASGISTFHVRACEWNFEILSQRLRMEGQSRFRVNSCLHPSVDIRNKNICLHDFGEQGSPVHTKNLQNGLETARHGLIIRQHGATAYMDLLEGYFQSYQSILNRFLMKIIDFPGTRVWGVENHAKKHRS